MVGPDAKVSWVERVRALILLVLAVLVLAAALTAFVGVMIFVGTLMIDILAS